MSADVPSPPASLQGRRYLLVTLGCFRNEVESDLLRGALARSGLDETTRIDEADVALVMTCGFIREACDEGIDTILELSEVASLAPSRPPIVVLGCMSQRYGAGLVREMPEISGALGADWAPDLQAGLKAVLQGERFVAPARSPRLSTHSRVADSSDGAHLYVRASDGCDRGCRFCAIPSIRGPHASRPVADVVEETARLCAGRQREVILLAQDLTAYGSDLDEGTDLAGLLRQIARVEGAHWVRMLYLQPEGVTDRLIEAVAAEPAVVGYFDVPFQHASHRVLRAMGRPGSAAEHLALIDRIRSAVPDAAIRSTVMVGYPGETERDFEELAGFIEEARLDWLGAFVFSPEEGTAAASLPGNVTAEVALSRYNKVLEIQEAQELRRAGDMLGRGLEVVVEAVCELEGYDLVGRSYREAPVVDGIIYLLLGPGGRTPRPGEFVAAKIKGQEGLDLVGEI